MTMLHNSGSQVAKLVVLGLFFVIAGCGNSAVNDDGDDVIVDEFTVFRTADGLIDNGVQDVLVDYIRGGLWFATLSGVSFYSTGESAWYSYGAESTLLSLEITSLALDMLQGGILAGTTSGVSYFNGDSWFMVADADSLVHPYVNAVEMVGGGNIWVGTRGGLSIRSSIGWQSLPDSLGVATNAISDIEFDIDGDSWIATNNGVAVFDGAEWQFYNEPYLPSSIVNCLFRSHNGAMWVGTTNGVAVYNGSQWQRYTMSDGLPGFWVNDFTETRDHTVWVATDAGAAYFSDGRFHAVSLPDSVAAAVVTSVEADMMTDFLWLGTSLGAIRVKHNR